MIQDRETYIGEALKLLGDQETYEKLKGDPVVQYQKDFKSLLDSAITNGVLTKDENHFLKYPATPYFYHIP